MKALIIDEPWIGLILSGAKNWEMRKTVCHFRGRFALIRKGSGAVVGTARLIDSLLPLDTSAAYAAAEPFHRIPAGRRDQAFADGWRTPWVIGDVRPLGRPVPYSHPSGAVIWVNLSADVVAEIDRQGGPEASLTPTLPPLEKPAPPAVRAPEAPLARKVPPAPTTTLATPPALAGSTAYVTLTGGNIRNNHISLSSIIGLFPADAIGGRNAAQAADRTIHVTFTPGMTVSTDIDGSKKLLRTRGPVGDFFARSGAGEGDTVAICRTAPYAFTFSIHRPT